MRRRLATLANLLLAILICGVSISAMAASPTNQKITIINLDSDQMISESPSDIGNHIDKGDRITIYEKSGRTLEIIVEEVVTPIVHDLPFGITGTYKSDITGDTRNLYLKKPNPVVRIVRNGNEITGSYGDSGGKIWGEIDGNTIKFEWLSPGVFNGKGTWTVKPESNEIVGTWFNLYAGEGNWDLTKIGPKEEILNVDLAMIKGRLMSDQSIVEVLLVAIDKIEIQQTITTKEASTMAAGITGTYWSHFSSNKGIYKNFEVVLTQNGNMITGFFVPDEGDRISGTIEGDTINFLWIAPGRGDRKGFWTVRDGGANLKGNWWDFIETEGKWRLEKVSSEATVPESGVSEPSKPPDSDSDADSSKPPKDTASDVEPLGCFLAGGDMFTDGGGGGGGGGGELGGFFIISTIVVASVTTSFCLTILSTVASIREEETAYRKMQQYRLAAKARDNLARDMAQGGGEYVTAMAYLHGCSVEVYDSFALMTQRNFNQIFPQPDLGPETILLNLEVQISKAPLLVAECSEIS